MKTSILDYNLGPEPPEPLPDTPENRADRENLWAQIHDPTHPLGALNLFMIDAKDVDERRRAITAARAKIAAMCLPARRGFAW